MTYNNIKFLLEGDKENSDIKYMLFMHLIRITRSLEKIKPK